jgi:hypothetical protein
MGFLCVMCKGICVLCRSELFCCQSGDRSALMELEYGRRICVFASKTNPSWALPEDAAKPIHTLQIEPVTSRIFSASPSFRLEHQTFRSMIYSDISS